jgi:hypothetical protein
MAKRPAKKSKVKVKARVKPPQKKAVTKTAKKAVKKAAKPARTLTVVIPQMIKLSLPPVLHDRLKGLTQIMGLSTEGVIRQALTEFCDTWEDHHRTVSALADTGDRMQIVQRD